MKEGVELMDRLQQCLPAHIRDRGADIRPIAAGLSGAGVYHVATSDEAFVLKVTALSDPLEAWQRRVRVQQLAGERGVAPEVVHVDVERRAVVSRFVQDQSFAPLYGNPASRSLALQKLADTLRTVHAMDPSNAATGTTPESFLESAWSDLVSRCDPPEFVCDVVARVRGLAAPPVTTVVLSHNDVNPSNIVYDGTRVMLLDWDTSGQGSPYYDLAAAAVFFRMDDAASLGLIAAYDGSALTEVPEEFRYNQALVATMCGVIFLRLAMIGGYSAVVSRATISDLSQIYTLMRSGQFDVSSAEGKWQFGLALLKAAHLNPLV